MWQMIIAYLLYISAKNITQVVKYYCISLIIVALLTYSVTPAISITCVVLFLLYRVLKKQSTFRKNSYPGLKYIKDIETIPKRYEACLAAASAVFKYFIILTMIMMPAIMAIVTPESTRNNIELELGNPYTTCLAMALPYPVSINMYVMCYDNSEEDAESISQITLNKALFTKSDIAEYGFMLFANLTVCSGISFLFERKREYKQLKIEEDTNGTADQISSK